MNKICFLASIILFCLSSYSQAQNQNFGFGIKAGANYSKFTADFDIGAGDYVEYQRKPGFYLGAFLNQEVLENLYFQPELHFALQRTDFLLNGIEIRTNDPNAGNTVLNVETNITELVIALPLVLRYYPLKFLFLDAGPQAGFIIDRSEEVKNDPFDGPGDQGNTIDFEHDKFDLGFTVGTGYNLTRHFSINARYFFGIIERDNSINSSVFTLGLEYLL